MSTQEEMVQLGFECMSINPGVRGPKNLVLLETLESRTLRFKFAWGTCGGHVLILLSSSPGHRVASELENSG